MSAIVRAMTTIGTFIKNFVQSNGTGPIIIVGAFVVGIFYSIKQRMIRGRPGEREQLTSQTQLSQGSSGAFTGKRTTRDGKQPRPRLLSGVRRATIGGDLSNFLFTYVDSSSDSDLLGGASNSEPLIGTSSSKALVVKPEYIDPLRKIAGMCDLFIITRVSNDEEEEHISKALEKATLFEKGLVNPAKVIFCQTVMGRVSVVRQLEPHLHIDCDVDVAVGLQRFIKSIAFVSNMETKAVFQPNVTRLAVLNDILI